MVDEQVDLVHRDVGGADRLLGAERQFRDRLPERLVPAHPDHAVLAADPDVIGTGPVGPEDHRTDQAVGVGRLQHDRTRAIAEHDGGRAVQRIRDP